MSAKKPVSKRPSRKVANVRRELGRPVSAPVRVHAPTVDPEEIYGTPHPGQGRGNGAIASSADLTEEERERIRRTRQKKGIRAEKERKRQHAIKDRRANLILSPELKAQLLSIADSLHTSQSSVITFLAYHAMSQISKSGTSVIEYLKDYLVAGDNLHWQFKAVHPDDPTKKDVR